MTSAKTQKHRVLPGFVSGLVTAALFNPWDRALFLSIVHNRAFLMTDNFKTPFQGLTQTLMHRTISNGLYFVLQDATYDGLCAMLQAHRTETRVVFLAGLLAGAANGALLNSIAAVKYQGWALAGPSDQFSFALTARQMYREGGWLPFFKGTRATVTRDAAFGVTYELLRHLPVLVARSTEVAPSYSTPSHQFLLNVSAAVCATMVSAPFNYVRNVQYASSPQAPPTTIMAELRTLYCEVCNDATPWRTLQRRLRLGWGSLRVGIGMAVGTTVFELAQTAM
jgi:hypothetical protein